MLVDAGRGASHRIVESGTSITEVGYVFITHHHFDHTGGLSDFLFAAWNMARNRVIKVFGPKGTRKMVSHLFRAFERDIMYRLTESVLTDEKLVDIRDMVEVNDVEPGVVYDSGDWSVTAVYVKHGLGMTQEDWPCLAYRIESEGGAVVVSGDAVTSPELIEISRDADVLLMCCYLAGDEIVDHDLELISKHVIASSLTAGKIASEAGVKRLVLIHVKEKSQEMLDSMLEDVRRDYDRQIIIGEDLMEIVINLKKIA